MAYFNLQAYVDNAMSNEIKKLQAENKLMLEYINMMRGDLDREPYDCTGCGGPERAVDVLTELAELKERP